MNKLPCKKMQEKTRWEGQLFVGKQGSDERCFLQHQCTMGQDRAWAGFRLDPVVIASSSLSTPSPSHIPERAISFSCIPAERTLRPVPRRDLHI
jgi:hypothetical protein